MMEGKVESATEPGKKRQAIVVAAVAETTTAVAGKAILNFLITGVIHGEIMLSKLRATIETPLIMAILTGLVQSTAICTYPWHLLH